MFQDRCSGVVYTAELCILKRARRYTARLELVHSLEFYEALAPAEVLGLQMKTEMLHPSQRFNLAVRLPIARLITLPLTKADSYLWIFISIVASNVALSKHDN